MQNGTSPAGLMPTKFRRYVYELERNKPVNAETGQIEPPGVGQEMSITFRPDGWMCFECIGPLSEYIYGEQYKTCTFFLVPDTAGEGASKSRGQLEKEKRLADATDKYVKAAALKQSGIEQEYHFNRQHECFPGPYMCTCSH